MSSNHPHLVSPKHIYVSNIKWTHETIFIHICIFISTHTIIQEEVMNLKVRLWNTRSCRGTEMGKIYVNRVLMHDIVTKQKF